MEKFDLYDCKRNKIEKTISRGEKCPHGTFRLVVHLCIFNEKDEMLIQQRSSNKSSNPNKWDISLGGCVQSGEDSQSAVQRETNEELGLNLDFSQDCPALTISFDTGFDDIFIKKADIKLSDVTFKDNEVQNVKWASKQEILTFLKSGKFIKYKPSFIELLFDLNKSSGTFEN